MRILKLRFENLNSLAGKWEINFEHPSYAADGIFLISGPTGAGKTTILDAVCLALYGATPRLDKITKNANELMSRRTGECWAEVTFSAGNDVFRAHFSQRRARSRAGGALQQPQHELARLPQGEIIAKGLREVPACIENLTGLDFTRFTRSMLLAQGEFAAFLQANADERAEILEQITGTQHYSEISRMVHVLYGERRAQEEAFWAQMQGLAPLPEEERRKLEEKWRLARERMEHLALQQRHLEEGIQILEQIETINEEIEKLRFRREENRRERETFAPQKARLEAALQAQALDADAVQLQHLRSQLERLQKRIQDILGQMEQVRQEGEAAQKRQEECTRVQEEAQRAQEEGLALLVRVRELDARLAQERAGWETRRQALDARRQELENARSALENAGKKENELNAEIEKCEAFLREHAGDAQLEWRLPVIREKYGEWRKLQKRIQDVEVACDNAERRKLEELKKLQKAQKEEDVLRREAAACGENAKKAEEKKKGALGGMSLSDGYQEISRLEKERADFADLALKLGELERENALLTEKRNRLPQVLEQKEKLEKEVQETQEALQRVREEIEELERAAERQREVKSLEQLRARLRDGEPCPLCGSPHHPWVQAGVPQPEETGHLAECRRKSKELEKKSSHLLQDLTRAEEQWRRLEEEIGQGAGNVQNTIEKISFLVNKCKIAQNECCREILEARMGGLDGKIESFQQRLQEAAQLDEVIANERKNLDEIRKKLDNATKTVANSQGIVERLEGEMRGLSEERQRRGEEMQVLKEALLIQLREFMENLQEIEDAAIARLENCLQAYLGFRKRMAETKELMEAAKKEKEKAQAVLGEREAALAEAKRLEEECRGRLQGLDDERKKLFGEQDPDVYDRELAARMQAANAELETARMAAVRVQERGEGLKRERLQVEEEVAITRMKLESFESEFAVKLQKAGFASEDSYRAARLEESQREELQKRLRELETVARELEAQEKNAIGKCSELMKKSPEKPLDELREERNAVQRERSAADQEIGACSQAIQTDDKVREALRGHQAEYERLKEETRWWGELHALIGSADGKKFRMFAQSLTLDALVGHANRQLMRLSDRYLLLRTPESLDLSVMDRYQGDEIRPTCNLSGGETFLVSLALALGLSCMAGHRMRIDTLFLDEGFGTLDPQTLEYALGALAVLRQEGKIIGIISHVSELRDRLAVQIRVEPRPGGISEIGGPGCSRLS